MRKTKGHSKYNYPLSIEIIKAVLNGAAGLRSLFSLLSLTQGLSECLKAESALRLEWGL